MCRSNLDQTNTEQQSGELLEVNVDSRPPTVLDVSKLKHLLVHSSKRNYTSRVLTKELFVMKQIINYKSVVTIGSFNPAILTHDFLCDHCDFERAHNPKGSTNPVLSEIKYGNLILTMELNRFQIQLLKCDDFDDEYPVSLMNRYLNILEFTPLGLMGVNFNYCLSGLETGSLANVLTSPLGVSDFFGFDPTLVRVEVKKPNGTGLTLSQVIVTHQLNSDFKNTIKIDFEDAAIAVNSNYEIDRLDKHRSRIDKFSKEYGLLVSDNSKLTQLIGEFQNG